MTRTVLLTIAAAALLVDGYVYGRWTNRWGTSDAVDRAVASLRRVPLDLGKWHGTPLDLGDRQAQRAGFSGYWLRRYQREDGAIVNVMLACGIPGPLSVHTPEVCYAANGYAPALPPEKYRLPSAPEQAAPEFWKSTFVKKDSLAPVNLRLFWSWRASNHWQVPGHPRFDFARQPVLYKMYIAHEMTGIDERQDDAICAEFMQLLLPELERSLSAQP